MAGGFEKIAANLIWDQTMAYARGKVLFDSPVARPAPSPLRRVVVARAHEALREIESLRAVNEHLMRELAALKLREAQAQRLADRDGLTGLYNRRRMLELLNTAVHEAELQGQWVGLLFVDLNGFKAVNDEYGHAAGDKILVTAAMRIATRVRAGDFVCRYGGDEFVVILPGAPDAAAVTQVADTIRRRVALPYWIEGTEQHLTAAVGESSYPHDASSASELLLKADQAMYRLKARLARPMVSLGSMPEPHPARRRGD
jgi:diguanylate cyclase (GGDEF)-like protein